MFHQQYKLLRRLVLGCALLTAVPLAAQQIDLSLHATAVPDSFEVRARSTSGVFSAIPNAVFTLRWELASGGVMDDEEDVAWTCPAFAFRNYEGMLEFGAFRYFTLVLIGDRSMMRAGCTIGTEEVVLCGVRIRGLSGCRNVSLAQDAYTGMNNLAYFFSVGGIDATGRIISDPISVGDCPDCVPPVIDTMYVGDLPRCTTGTLDFSVEARGTDLEYNWRSPVGASVGYTASGTVRNAGPGEYSVTVINGCGMVTERATTGFDPPLCDPPNLTAAWFEMLPQWGHTMRLHVEGSGSCVNYSWVMPSGQVVNGYAGGSVVSISVPGVYTVIAVGACGSDTIRVELTPEMICLPPEIISVTSDVPQPICTVEPFTLSVQCTQTATFEWTGPGGVWTSSGASLRLDHPQDGAYQVRAQNGCGVDSAIYQVQLDTVGLADCVPPVIHGITSVPACIGDTVRLFADVEASGPCLTYTWSGTNVVPSNGPSTMVTGFPGREVQLEVANVCGAATFVYEPPFTPLRKASTVFCGLDNAVSLDSIYAEYMVEGGAWLLDGIVVPGLYDPAVDTNAYYYYRWPNGCHRLRTFVADYPRLNAGRDTSVLICSDAQPLDLFTLLGPEAQSGGSWLLGASSLSGGIFDPQQFFGYFTWEWRYLLMSPYGFCNHEAVVSVEEVEYYVWYADTDGDGLGDPLDSLLSCGPEEGYVLVAGDECPSVPGTIGSPCGDALELTINAACECVGLTALGVDEGIRQEWQLWPNPASGEVYLKGVGVAGRVQIQVMDAGGRVVQQMERTAGATVISWSTVPLAAGTYSVRLVSAGGARVLRLVVQ